MAQVPPGVVGASVVMAAQGEAVVEVGVATAGPGEFAVVDLAPGEGAFASGDGAGLAAQGKGATLVVAVQPMGAAEVEGNGVAAEDGGDQSGFAG